MRRIIGALALALLATSEPVFAQPTPWTDPTGSFRLTFPDGWEAFDGGPADIVSVGPRGSQSGSPKRDCKVTVTRPTLVQNTQPAANEFVRNSYNQANLLTMMLDRQPRVQQYSNDLIRGVQVASIVVESHTAPGEARRLYQRHFALAMRGVAPLAYHVSCEMDLRAGEADRRGMETLLESLTFIPKA